MTSELDYLLIAKEVARQLKEDKLVTFDGSSSGLTQRDLIVEMRQDLKDVKAVIPNFVTKGQLATATATMAGLILGIVKLFF